MVVYEKMKTISAPTTIVISEQVSGTNDVYHVIVMVSASRTHLNVHIWCSTGQFLKSKSSLNLKYLCTKSQSYSFLICLLSRVRDHMPSLSKRH